MPLLQDDSSSPRPLEIAAIDLGSNSFHMIIARVVNGALQVLSRLKQRVYLADGLDDNDKLSEEAMLRGLSALSFLLKGYRDFQQKMSLWSVHIRYGLLAMPKSFCNAQKR